MIGWAKRSLKASLEGLKRANRAALIFATKTDFAAELEIPLATVQNFFAGRPIERETFHKICQRLELPWRAIAELPEETASEQELSERDKGNDIDALVQKVRQKGHASIQQRCGTMRVLDMSQPIGLNDIYIKVNILEQISGRKRLEVADLLKVCSEEFQRPGLGRSTQDRLPGLEAVQRYSKLIILSKPGLGKTTFLKYLAIKCSFSEFQANLVPIFITFKDFAETERQPSLLEYLTKQLSTEGIADTVVAELLNHGKMLILMDGLDEVKEIDSQRVLREVRSFYTQFHANRFVITCRIAAREYTFEQFTEVEITEFEDEQIASFANKWFAAKEPSKAERFIQKLKENSPIQELAICPLLLTLLCLVFEESADFPSNRSELYKEGLDILLKKWDAQRNVERDQVYKKLSVQHKEDILSQIALITFKRGDYFFEQKEIAQHITDYIYNLPQSLDPETLQLDSEAVVKSIEAQHGLLVERAHLIYSFSHLTFQEYFTAKEIVASPNPQALKKALKNLVDCITNRRWREVFLLTVGMLRNADYLLQLMKQQIDDLIAKDKHLQAFLTWVSQKSCAVTACYKSVAVRAFYLDRTLDLDFAIASGNLRLDLSLALTSDNLALALALDPNLALNRTLDPNLALDRILDRTLDLALTVTLDLTIALDLGLPVALDRAIDLALTFDPALVPGLEHEGKRSPLGETLQQLKAQIPDSEQDREKFKEWWIAFGQAWIETLRTVMILYRNIGHDWQFSDQQKQVLRQYYYANQLLVDCLNSHCYVTRAVRNEISETLLLPIAEISPLGSGFSNPVKREAGR